MSNFTSDVTGSFRQDGIKPEDVHARLAEHLLVDGFPFVLDTQRSRGSWLVDSITGDAYLDLYTFFASSTPAGLRDVAGGLPASRCGHQLIMVGCVD